MNPSRWSLPLLILVILAGCAAEAVDPPEVEAVAASEEELSIEAPRFAAPLAATATPSIDRHRAPGGGAWVCTGPTPDPWMPPERPDESEGSSERPGPQEATRAGAPRQP